MRALCASGQAACLAACRADAPQAAPLFRPTECSPRSRRGAPHVHRCHAASRRRRAVELSAAVDAVLAEAQPLPSAPVFITPQPALPYDQWLSPEALRCAEPEAAPLRVALLLSGGVDSSLALNLACAAGHTVTAFYLQIWFQEDFRNFWDACPWEDDLAYARAVCDQARVQLRVVPLTCHYWDHVVSACVADIAAGRTPNPDVLCNSRIKFGAFMEYLHSEHAGQFDRVASGHYARLDRWPTHDGTGAALPPILRCCADAVKDQTYFLAALSPAQLASAMFPLGALPKASVRTLAQAGRLPPAERKDSQGICFLGKVKFSEFVAQHLGTCPGSFVDADTGRRVGTHNGVWFYTIGQRKGIQLSGGPWYVVSKDPGRNLVYISSAYHAADKRRSTFRVGLFSWLGDARPAQGRNSGLRVKVRHGPETYGASLRWETPEEAAAAVAGSSSYLDSLYGSVTPQRHDPPPSIQTPAAGVPRRVDATAPAVRPQGSLSARVELDASDQGLAAGQYAVLYDSHGACFGCGVILQGAVGGGDDAME